MKNIYCCPRCNKWFDKYSKNPNTSCLVMHYGGCCHYGERELTAKQVKTIANMVESLEKVLTS